jgi:hypothetical protein
MEGFWPGFAAGMGCASAIWLLAGFVLRRAVDNATARAMIGRMW